jgi:adenylate cyclase
MSAELTIQLPGEPSCKRALDASYSIGRGRGNDLMLQDPRASRHHALIRLMGGSRYVLLDLGSSNGTFHNGHLVMTPVELKTGDEIQIADCILKFACQSPGPVGADTHSTTDTAVHTSVELVHEIISILVADVRGYTRLSEALPTPELSRLIGSWFRDASDEIERHGGCIDKFIGDAVMAYWLQGRGTDSRQFIHGPLETARALVQLAQGHHQRLAAAYAGMSFAIGCGVHMGQVIFGNIGQAARRDFTAMGDCVNVAFRLESLTKDLGRPILVSGEVREAAGDDYGFQDLGLQRLKGKSDLLPVFALE